MKENDIENYLRMVGLELQKKGLTVSILLLGGAVMLIEVRNRSSTKDIDAYFVSNYKELDEAIAVIASKENLALDWLNDDVSIVVHQVKAPKSQRLWKATEILNLYIPVDHIKIESLNAIKRCFRQ